MKDLAVVKFGSGLIRNTEGIDEDAIDRYAAGLVENYMDGGLIVVTSGAVEAGRHRIEQFYGDMVDMRLTDQDLAALGGTAVFHAWEQAFRKQEVLASSVAVTHRQLGAMTLWQRFLNREEKRTFAQLLADNCALDIVTVINEADAISVTELMKLAYGGDNDGLASHLAQSTKARSLTIFTKRGGVFDDEGNLVEEVNQSNIDAVRQFAEHREAGGGGRGGLPTKVDAAWRAAKAGVAEVRIAAVNDDMTGDKATRFMLR